MAVVESFLRPKESELMEQFLRDGYVICEADDRAALDSLRRKLVETVCGIAGLSLPQPQDDGKFLDSFHEQVPVEKLNDVRVATYNKMNAFSWFRPTYFAAGRSAIEALVGNELSMQSKINFSIQYPKDESSLLAVHADTWTGESPFQIVMWVPLVDVWDTKSMYILSPEKNRTVNSRLKNIAQEGGSDKLFEAYRNDFQWLTINYGQILLFTPTLLHGNIVNQETSTRWSMNTRFTGLFTPYVTMEKGLGTFYLPITARPISRIGMSYKDPEGFE